MIRLLSLTIAFFLIVSGTFAQQSRTASDKRAPQTRFVDATGTDAGDCTTPDNPCASVGFAIEQADDGDTIDIAAGTYVESITLDKSLSLQGAGRESTFLRASTARSLRDRVITIGPGLEVIISGVTISHGWAGSWSTPPRLGGGIYNEGSELALSNVTLLRNKTTGGGGAGVANVNASGTFSNVIFQGNFTDSSGGRGGGLLNIESDLVLTNVVFTRNAAERGGGMFNSGSSPSLTNVTLHDNIGENVGGGLFNAEQSSPFLLNTIVLGHLIGGSEGVEIFNDESSSIELHYSLFGDGPGAIVEGGGFEATNSLSASPFSVFLRPYGRNLRLRDGAPAINAGDPNTNLALFPANDDGEPIDLDGNLRLVGDGIDIGAYEHQGTTPTAANDASLEISGGGLGVPRPNPARSQASLTLRLPAGQTGVAKAQRVTVEVFDRMGRRVQTLYDGTLAAGMNETLTIDASTLSAGVYVIRATGEDFVETRRVTTIP